MSVKLHLGVVEQPYTEGGTTTGDVADFLEAKYHPMETFWAIHEQEAANDLASGFAGALESVMMGAPLRPDQLFLAGTTKIDDRFKLFITTGEMEALGMPGVPTKASIERRSARFKSGRSSRPRPSFVDTGLYVDSFTSWVEIMDWQAMAEDAARAYQGAH